MFALRQRRYTSRTPLVFVWPQVFIATKETLQVVIYSTGTDCHHDLSGTIAFVYVYEVPPMPAFKYVIILRLPMKRQKAFE